MRVLVPREMRINMRKEILRFFKKRKQCEKESLYDFGPIFKGQCISTQRMNSEYWIYIVFNTFKRVSTYADNRQPPSLTVALFETSNPFMRWSGTRPRQCEVSSCKQRLNFITQCATAYLPFFTGMESPDPLICKLYYLFGFSENINWCCSIYVLRFLQGLDRYKIARIRTILDTHSRPAIPVAQNIITLQRTAQSVILLHSEQTFPFTAGARLSSQIHERNKPHTDRYWLWRPKKQCHSHKSELPPLLVPL